jgi:recombinational DNA repair protein RecT
MNNITALEKVVKDRSTEIWKAKADYLMTNKEAWFKRALLEISESDQLAEIASAEEGVQSIMSCLRKALQMGLMIGGIVPHASLVPFNSKSGDKWIKKAVLVPSFEGYRFIACSGKNPVILDIEVRAVYQKEAEHLDIDFGKGTVTGHRVVLDGDRGDLVGVYGLITHIDGRQSVDWMPKKEIDRIRDTYSKGHQAYVDKKASSSIWVTEYDKQAIKTAGKQFLKKYASQKESLEMAFEEESQESPADRIIHNIPAIELKKEDVKVENSEPEKETKKTGKLFGEK